MNAAGVVNQCLTLKKGTKMRLRGHTLTSRARQRAQRDGSGLKTSHFSLEMKSAGFSDEEAGGSVV